MVTAGAEANSKIEIISGLQPGALVATRDIIYLTADKFQERYKPNGRNENVNV